MRKITLTLNILILFTIGLFFNSCDKSSSKIDEDTTIPYETYLKIKIGGVENPNVARSLLPIFDKKIASTLPISETKSELGVWTDVGDGLDAFTTFDVLEQAYTSDQSLKNNIKNNVAKLTDSDISVNKEDFQAATVPLGSNKKYRLLVYDATNTLVNPTNNVFTAGSLATLKVDAGKQYTWIAYSLDETTDPPFNPTTLQLTTSELGNKNILYARSSAAITANYGENLLNIILKHHRVRYDVIIDPRGLFAEMANSSTIDIGIYAVPSGSTTGVKTFTSLVRNANLNILTGTYGTASINSVGITASNMRDTTVSGCTTCKVATFYTTNKEGVALNTLAIKFQPLIINHPSAANPTNYGTDLVAIFNNTAYTPSENNFYRLTARLLPGVNTGNGKVWAPSNLMYEGGTYKFRGTNYYTAIENVDYFKFRALTPGNGGSVNSGDPCSRVLPLNTWRLPTTNEYNQIINLGSTTYQTTAGLIVLGTTYAVKFNVSENAIANMNDPLVAEFGKGLYFNFGGYYNAGTFVLGYLWNVRIGDPFGVSAIGIGVGTSFAQYWTGTNPTTNTASYFAAEMGEVGISTTLLSTRTSLYTLGVTDSRNDGLLIRCIRDAPTTP